jgi:hypothetical protein
VGAGSDPESPPNQSALSQLRTNEIELVLEPGFVQPPAETVWELREFRVEAANTGLLRPVTVQGTPDIGYNDRDAKNPKSDLAGFLTRELPDILARKHQVPVVLDPSRSFMAGSAITPANFFWNAAGAEKEARHIFSKFTCNGCHARETFPAVGTPDAPFDNVKDPAKAKDQPPHFTHVRPRLAKQVTQLSAFLTGKDSKGQPYELADPVDTTIRRAFHDLSDRAHDLKGLVEYGSWYELSKIPTQRIH